MTKQTTIMLALFGTLLVIAIGLAGLLYLRPSDEEPESEQPVGEVVTEVTLESQAPLPTVLATTEPEDETGEQGESADPTPVPTVIIVGDVGSVDTGSIDISKSPKLAELIEKYPEIATLMANLDLSDEQTLREVYRLLIEMYEKEGFRALREIMGETGLLTAIKLNSAYLDFALAYELEGFDAAVDLARKRRLINEDDELRLVLILDTEDMSLITPILEENNITNLGSHGNEIEIGIPLSELQQAASSEDAVVRLVQLAYTPHVVGVRTPDIIVEQAVNAQVVGEGVANTAADQWHAAGFTGQGVRVGVIDPGGFGNYQALLGTDLPSSVTTMQAPDALNAMRGVHGTASAEIIYEMAPGIELFFAQAETHIEFENAVDWMIAQNVAIISYSAGTFFAPMDGTGPDVEAVKRATDNGILWVNAAGNSAEEHLYMEFTDENGNGFHEFPHGGELLSFDHFGAVQVFLSWDDVWGGATQDFDFFIVSADELDLDIEDWEHKAWDPQGGSATDVPFEGYVTELANRPYYLVIQGYDVTRPSKLNLFTSYVDLPYAHPQYSLLSPGDAPSALTVGAVNWQDSSLAEYSSQGPTLDGRDKPDISAPAGVSGSSYIGEPFHGTSASAPHVAGAAAILFSANAQASADDVRNYLLDNAIDAGPAGYDYGYGSGFLTLGNAPSSADPAPRAGTPSATINTVEMEHNVYVSQQKGMLIYTDFRVSNMNQQRGFAVATFYDSGGNPLPDRNEQFVNSSGNIASTNDFTPIYDDARFSDYPLFLPYSELELGAGAHQLSFRVAIFDSNGNALANSNPLSFRYSSDAGRLGGGTISNISVQHNMTRDGVDGMVIRANLDVRNGAGKPAGLTAFFYFDNSANRPLRDFNNRYRTQQGDVAVGRTFTPNSANESYTNFELFMPYEELHMDPAAGLRHELKFYLALTGGDGWRKLDASPWVSFWLQQ